MPWDGSGNFNRSDGVFTGTQIWQNNRDAGTKITAVPHDTQDQDLADGLENCLTRDGQNSPSANLPMNSKKLTGLADGSADTDSVSLKQIKNGAFLWCGTSGGSANAQTLTPSPATTGLVAGQIFRFVAGFTNTGAMTVDISALGALAVRIGDGSYGVPARLVFVGNVYEIVYTGSYLLLRPAISQYLVNENGKNWGVDTSGHLIPSTAVAFDIGASGSEARGIYINDALYGKDSLTCYAQTANLLLRGTSSIDLQCGASSSWHIGTTHHLYPDANGATDIGTSSKLIRDIYYNDSLKAANRTWTPTVTGIDSTVTSLTVSEADYCRVAQYIFFNYYVFFNITVANEVSGFYVSLPTSGPSQTIIQFCRAVESGVEQDANYNIDGPNSRMLVTPTFGNSFAIGTAFVLACDGKYRAV